jgi:hypothetical protein
LVDFSYVPYKLFISQSGQSGRIWEILKSRPFYFKVSYL